MNPLRILAAVYAVLFVFVTSLNYIPGLTDADWACEGWHTDTGRYSAETWLRIYAAHAHDHAAQIRRLKDALAK